MSHRTGHAVVEFALVFPLFLSLAVISFHLVFLGLRQFQCQRLGMTIARELAMSSATSAPELLALAHQRLSRYEPVDVTVRVTTWPSPNSITPHRASKYFDLIDITLEKSFSPLKVKAHARDVRVRPAGGS